MSTMESRDNSTEMRPAQPLRVRSDSNEAMTWGRYVSLATRPRLAYLVGKDAAWGWRPQPGSVEVVDRGELFFD